MIRIEEEKAIAAEVEAAALEATRLAAEAEMIRITEEEKAAAAEAELKLVEDEKAANEEAERKPCEEEKPVAAVAEVNRIAQEAVMKRIEKDAVEEAAAE
jgi:hypothetical protein